MNTHNEGLRRRAGAASQGGNALVGGAAVLVVIGLLAATSRAPLEVMASGFTLITIIFLLWRKDDPPILVLPPLFQWSEVAIVPISTIWKDVPLNALSPSGTSLNTAAIYGLLGILCLSVGLRLGMGVLRGFNRRLREDTQRTGFRSVAKWSFGLIAGGYVFESLSGSAGPARELFLQAGNLRYVGLFMLTYWCLINQKQLGLLFLVICFEILFGLTGFFAEFKNSLLVVIVAVAAARSRPSIRNIALISCAVGLLLAIALFWTHVKQDYRSFVNMGSGEQVVLVSLGERVDFITRRVFEFGAKDTAVGLEQLVDRHGYIEFLARTMNFVPGGIAHENGALTAATFRHITMPRFIFPGKPTLPSDTEIMARYTGQDMLWSGNTSISIGHLGELYVDFGYIGGLIGMGTIGLVLGFVYRQIRNSYRSPLVMSAGLCLMAALPVAYFGTAYTKLVGAMIFSSAVAMLFQRYLALYLLGVSGFRKGPADSRLVRASI